MFEPSDLNALGRQGRLESAQKPAAFLKHGSPHQDFAADKKLMNQLKG